MSLVQTAGRLASAQARCYAWDNTDPWGVWRQPENTHRGSDMKDVKVDVRVNVNVGVDTASVVLLLASVATALFFYKQHKHEKLAFNASQRSPLD